MSWCDKNQDVSVMRFKRAIAIMVVMGTLFVFACMAGLVSERGSEPVQTYVSMNLAEDVLLGVGVDESFERAGFVPVDEGSIPSDFALEVLPASEMKGGYATADWLTVGFVTEISSAETQNYISGQLLQKGWYVCESGFDGVVTYTKAEGVYVWLMMSCVAIGDATSVVFQIKTAA